MALLDLISDTATLPTDDMKRAMMAAPLGDEQKGEDPTVLALEERMASLLGHERALFVPSATLANQIALALLAQAGDEIICHRTAHVLNHECGGVAMTSRAQLHPLDTQRGIFGADDVARVLRADDPHYPRSRAVVVENTSNGGGGSVWPLATLDALTAFCDERGLSVHLDGARLWHAAVKLRVPLSRLTQGTATVQVCFSKGLGCPFGAVLALPSSSWPRARRLKQAMGGCLRQAGIAAGAMLYALDHHVERLAIDHDHAAQLAAAIADIVDVEPTETNLVFFSVRQSTAVRFCEQLLRFGVRMAPAGPTRVRACVHMGVHRGDIAAIVDAVHKAVS